MWGYTDFGAPGEIEKREHIADLDLELVTFKNGVRLNLKRTDFETGQISASARVVVVGAFRLTRRHRFLWIFALFPMIVSLRVDPSTLLPEPMDTFGPIVDFERVTSSSM